MFLTQEEESLLEASYQDSFMYSGTIHLNYGRIHIRINLLLNRISNELQKRNRAYRFFHISFRTSAIIMFFVG